MTIDEANDKCKSLEKLNIDIWNAKSTKDREELKAKFCACWKEICESGYKILRRRVFDYSLDCTVPKYKIRNDDSHDMISIIDNRGNGNHHGDCTTRCISFCTGIDYETIQKEQFKILAEVKSNYYGPVTWRSPRVWKQCLLKRNFCELDLPRRITAKVFIRKFKDSGINDGIIAAMSAHHVAAIDMKSKKILDTWNSAGCRITTIFVPAEQKHLWTSKLNNILN